MLIFFDIDIEGQVECFTEGSDKEREFMIYSRLIALLITQDYKIHKIPTYERTNIKL